MSSNKPLTLKQAASLGGEARAKALSAQRRKEIATLGGKARAEKAKRKAGKEGGQ